MPQSDKPVPPAPFAVQNPGAPPQNISLPGMLHGRVVRPPTIGASLASVDEASVANLPGLVKVVVRKNFGYLFIASATVGVMAFLASLFLPDVKEKTRPFEEVEELSFRSVLSVLRAPILWRWFLVIVVNMFFVSILFGFVPVYLYSLGYKPEVAGVFLSVLALSYLLVQPLAGWLADKYEARTIVLWGIVMSVLAVLLIPFTKGVPLAVISIVAGLGIGTVWTNSDAAVSSLAKDGRLGATMGIAGSFKEFGDMLGPLLIGILSQAFGLTAGFVACGVLGLLSVCTGLGSALCAMSVRNGVSK